MQRRLVDPKLGFMLLLLACHSSSATSDSTADIIGLDPPEGRPGFRTDGIYESLAVNPSHVRFTDDGWFCVVKASNAAAADELCGPSKTPSGLPTDLPQLQFAKGPFEVVDSLSLSLPSVFGERRTAIAGADEVAIVRDQVGQVGHPAALSYRFVPAIVPIDPPRGSRFGLSTRGLFVMEATRDRATRSYLRFDARGGFSILDTNAPVAEARATLQAGTSPEIRHGTYERTRFWKVVLHADQGSVTCGLSMTPFYDDPSGTPTLLCGSEHAPFVDDPWRVRGSELGSWISQATEWRGRAHRCSTCDRPA